MVWRAQQSDHQMWKVSIEYSYKEFGSDLGEKSFSKLIRTVVRVQEPEDWLQGEDVEATNTKNFRDFPGGSVLRLPVFIAGGIRTKIPQAE